MKNKIKWGVIGSGGIARRRTIPEGIMPSAIAELSSVFDTNSTVNEAVAGEFKTSFAKSMDSLLKSDIDAVYIASPVDSHFEHVIACAKAKKHILCEKPLGLSVTQAKQMNAQCEQNDVLLGVGLMMRFHSQHQAALKLVQEGKLGKIVYGRAQLSCWYPPIVGAWRQNPEYGGGGSLADMGSHCIDLLEMFCGRVNSINCFINNNVHTYKSEDSAVVTLKFENGAMGTVDSYFCIPDNSSKNMLELYGSRGSIIARGTIGQSEAGEMIAYLESDDIGYNAQQERSTFNGIEIKPKPVNMYMAEIEEFSRAIIENRKPSNHGLNGLRNQKILAACYESARTGSTIEMDYS